MAGLTLAGFLFLHVLFIRRARLETTWAGMHAHMNWTGEPKKVITE